MNGWSDTEKTAAQGIVFSFQELLDAMGPTRFRHYFVGAILPNLFGNMAEEEWKEFSTRILPCGSPGCDCHRVEKAAVTAFKVMREVFSKEMDKREGTQTRKE